MSNPPIINPAGGPVIVPEPERKARRTLKQAKGKMTLDEAEPTLRAAGEKRPDRPARLLKRQNRRARRLGRQPVETVELPNGR